MKTLRALLVAALLFLSGISGASAATILFPTGGGTGTNTVPTYGQVLVGNSGGTYTPTATSSLGIISGGNSFAYPFPSNATSTALTFSGGITIGSFNGILKAVSGLVSAAVNGTDYTLITAKTCTGSDFLNSVTAAGVFGCATPSGGSGGGLSTTTPWSGSGVAYRVSESAVSTAATGTVSGANGITATAGQAVIGSGLTITGVNALADGSTKGVSAYTANDFDSASGVISIDYANGQSAASGVKGFLTAADWATFNGKQAAGNYITALTGDGTASGPGSAALTLATVNANTGSFGGSTAIPVITFNGKGLATAVSTAAVIAPAGTLTGTTLNSGVTASSLTSVGTLTSLTVSGNTSLANATSTNEFSGRVTANTAAFGQTSSTSISSNGSITVAAGASITKTGTSDGCTTWSSGSLISTGSSCISTLSANTWLGLQTFQYGMKFTASTSPSYQAGMLVYDQPNNGLTFYNSDSNVSLQIGQEEWIRVFNNTGSTIPNGSAVYISGSNGLIATVALANAAAGATTIVTGLATEDILTNATGTVTTIGLVNGLNTSGMTAGATVYLSTTTPGGLVTYAGKSPFYRYRVGFVSKSDATTGSIHVTPSTAAVGNGDSGQVLTINATGNQTFATPLGYTFPSNATSTLLTFNAGITATGATSTFAGVNIPTQGLTIGTLPSCTGALQTNSSGAVICGAGSALIGTTGQVPYFSGTNTAAGTSTLFISTGSLVGIASTTPTALLSVGSAGMPSGFAIASSSIWSTAGAYAYTAPAGTAFVQVTMWGGGGTGGNEGGGAGAFVASTSVIMTTGQTGTIYVASGGNSTTGGTGYKAGGNAAAGGAGGGSSAFTASSTGQLICAAGGGGSGSSINQGGSAATADGGAAGTSAGAGGAATAGSGTTPGTGCNTPTFAGGAGSSGGAGRGGGAAGLAGIGVAGSSGGTGSGGAGAGVNGSGFEGGGGGVFSGPATGGNPGAGGVSGGPAGNGKVIVTAYGPATGFTGAQFIAGLVTIDPAAIKIGTTTSAGTVTIQSPANIISEVIAGFIGTTNYLFQTIDQWGHLITSGPAPSVASCGTTPTVVGNDRNGHINTSGTVTTCTVTFAKSYKNAPQCTVGGGTISTQAVVTTTTTFTATFTTSQAGTGINYICQGYQ